ncbi:sigma-70 family RNA polymerase sigma factor [Chryseolinea sp. T2]|uniref:RNA polymerase sigma factor n=1 Tax=Chryseolinea sp. T2 TaxID=3129255 RepID=UPI003077B564
MFKEDIQRIHDLTEENSIIEKSQLDPAYFKPLYEKYFKRIFLFVYRRIGEKEITADITSQIFLKALTNLKKYEPRGLPFSAWLFRIAINECSSFFRKTKRERLVSIDSASVDTLFEDLTTDHGIEDLHRRLPHLLRKLSADELQIIELRYFEQRPFKEVGDILGISETYAKVRVYRALDKMKRLFMTH